MKNKLVINIHALYITNIIIIIFLGLIVTLLRGFTSINLVRYILLLNLTNNVIYILYNIKKVKFKFWTLSLFILVMISFFKGLVFNPFSERVILDIYKPLSFIFVFQIFSSIKKEDRDLILFNIKTRYSKILFRLSVFFGVLVVILLAFFKGYPGLRLPLIIPLTVYSISLSNVSVILLVLAALFSGKRAVLIASFPVLLLALKKQLTLKKIIIFFSSVALILLLLYPKLESINKSKAFNKYRYSIIKFEEFKETKDLEILNIATGQRVQEITSAFHRFSISDFLFGKGVGYTYDLYNVKRTKLLKEDYGNIHFSPASLILSYGLIFSLIFYGSFINIILRCRKLYNTTKQLDIKILFFITLSFFIESFFAFVLFVLPFLPICLGLVSNYLKDSKK